MAFQNAPVRAQSLGGTDVDDLARVQNDDPVSKGQRFGGQVETIDLKADELRDLRGA